MATKRKAEDVAAVADCCFCLDAIVPGVAVFTAECSHSFHFKCAALRVRVRTRHARMRGAGARATRARPHFRDGPIALGTFANAAPR
jgi:hypothetical protein